VDLPDLLAQVRPDYLRVDATSMGGLTEALKVCAMAASEGLPVLPTSFRKSTSTSPRPSPTSLRLSSPSLRWASRRWTSCSKAGFHTPAALPLRQSGDRLTARGLYQLVHRLASRTELQTRCSPHVLRHTFARSFLMNGGDVFSLQRILGHSPSSIQATRRYVALLDDDLRAVHRLASPADRLGE